MSTECVIYGDYGERGTESRKRAWTGLYWFGLVALHCRSSGTPHIFTSPGNCVVQIERGMEISKSKSKNRGASHRVRLGATIQNVMLDTDATI